MNIPLTAKVRNAIGGKYKTYVVTIPSAYVKNGLIKDGEFYHITLRPVGRELAQTESEAILGPNAQTGVTTRVPAVDLQISAFTGLLGPSRVAFFGRVTEEPGFLG